MPLSLTACGGGGDKPSKADVQTRLSKPFTSQTGSSSLTSAQLDKLAKCVTDKVTATTLKAAAKR